MSSNSLIFTISVCASSKIISQTWFLKYFLLPKICIFSGTGKVNLVVQIDGIFTKFFGLFVDIINFSTASLDQKQFDRRVKCIKYLKTHRRNLYQNENAHKNFKKKDAERKRKERAMKKFNMSEKDVEEVRTKEREKKRRQRAEKKKLVECPPFTMVGVSHLSNALCCRLWVYVKICFEKCSKFCPVRNHFKNGKNRIILTCKTFQPSQISQIPCVQVFKNILHPYFSISLFFN